MEFYTLSYEDLRFWCAKQGLPLYVASQLFSWVYERKIEDFSMMSNLKKDLREKLQKEFTFSSLKLLRKLEAEDTVKFLWGLQDGKKVESVLLYAPGRRTLCVSSQVGCNARCAFCASGKLGLSRNLEAHEIIAQVAASKKYLQKEGKTLTHIVFMGMGEPLENFSNLQIALERLFSPQAFRFSPRRITVSTVGIPDKIALLAKLSKKVNLVLSLHAPNQRIRKKIIPYARRYLLEEDLLEACDEYAESTKRDITYEYILIDGINAELEHAKELGDLLQNRQCTVNLIPYNTIDKVSFRRPTNSKIFAFETELRRKKVRVTRRYTKGTKIAAACGQLALEEKESVISTLENR